MRRSTGNLSEASTKIAAAISRMPSARPCRPPRWPVAPGLGPVAVPAAGDGFGYAARRAAVDQHGGEEVEGRGHEPAGQDRAQHIARRGAAVRRRNHGVSPRLRRANHGLRRGANLDRETALTPNIRPQTAVIEHERPRPCGYEKAPGGFPPGLFKSSAPGRQARRSFRLWRATAPIPPKPRIIRAQVEGSGTALTTFSETLRAATTKVQAVPQPGPV